jgi:8-oxo-dGTP pyrophosphatase MutT (NUDIX family)
VLRNSRTVLMCHRHPGRAWFPNVWDFPGGHVGDAETLPQALVRELYEELGVVIDEPTGPPDAVIETESESTRLTVWVIDYSGPVINRSPAEHDELRWVSLRELADLEVADKAYLALVRDALEG